MKHPDPPLRSSDVELILKPYGQHREGGGEQPQRTSRATPHFLEPGGDKQHDGDG
jgi:hypothetical protein